MLEERRRRIFLGLVLAERVDRVTDKSYFEVSRGEVIPSAHRARTSRLCVERPINPVASKMRASARPPPAGPMKVRASMQTHSPCAARNRFMVRSEFTKVKSRKSSTALMPLPESAATATRSNGPADSPSTSA